MSDNVYSCEVCGRHYKNSKSLRTHKYSYHRQKEPKHQEKERSSHIKSVESERDSNTEMDHIHRFQSSTDTESQNSKSGDLQDRVLDMEIDVIEMKGKLDIVQLSVNELEKLVRSVKAEMLQETNRSQYDPKYSTQVSSKEFGELKFMIESNKNEIRDLDNRMNYLEEQSDAEENDGEELAAKDLLDDLKEIMSYFSQQEFHHITDDIPKLRRVLRFILKTIESNELNEEEFELLDEISTSSKSVAKTLVQDNFGWLVTMFKKMEKYLEKSLEPVEDDDSNESQEAKSGETESEIEENDSIQSDRSDSKYLDHSSLTSLSSIEGESEF